MLLNFIVLLVILVATAYFATQGLLSSLLAFVTATFSSILAMGMFEALQGTVAGYWPHLARGVAFLAVFTVAFGVTRFCADYFIPKNIKLPKLIDSASGGVLGFFASLVIVGTCQLGVGMLPVHTTILGVGGDQEYPTEARMQGSRQGEVVSSDGISMWPQRFTLAMWNGASGRGLGGDGAFAAVHPDLPMESYGYRNVTQYGSNPALPADLLKVEGPYMSSDPVLMKKASIEAGSQAAVLRLVIDKGSDSPHISCDTSDSMFRITPTQVRLVTDKGGGGGISQRYPIGLLVKGTTFEAMPLDVGHTVDDYVNEKVIQDWVFQLDPNEKPLFVEVKQLARVPVSATDKPLAKKEADAYPQQAYKESAGSIAVTVLDENNKPMAHVTVRLVPRSLDVNKVQTAMANAHSHIEDALSSDEGAWAPAFGKPGVPSRDKMSQANRDGNVGNAPVIGWRPLVTLLMLGETQPNGERNHSAMPAYFQSNIVPIITPEQRGESAKTGADGKVILPKVAPVDYCLIADGKTEAGSYCVWVADVEVKKKTETRKDLKPSEAAYLLTPVR